MRKYLLAAAAVAVSIPALAQTVDPRHDPNRMICKSTPQTGSRLVRDRVCMTRAQWNEMAQRTQEAHEEQMEMGRRINSQGTEAIRGAGPGS